MNFLVFILKDNKLKKELFKYIEHTKFNDDFAKKIKKPDNLENIDLFCQNMTTIFNKNHSKKIKEKEESSINYGLKELKQKITTTKINLIEEKSANILFSNDKTDKNNLKDPFENQSEKLTNKGNIGDVSKNRSEILEKLNEKQMKPNIYVDELTETKAILAETKKELTETKAILTETENELTEIKAILAVTKKELIEKKDTYNVEISKVLSKIMSKEEIFRRNHIENTMTGIQIRDLLRNGILFF